MARSDSARRKRSEEIIEYIKKNPLATDAMLADHFKVSINTIRLDRGRLGIKEFKERLKQKASQTIKQVTSISESEFFGDLIEYIPGISAKSRLEIKDYMTFENLNVAKGQYIYSFAETLAISLIPTAAALVGVANIKYANKIYSGDVVFAEAEVKRKTDTGYIVWVKIKDELEELKFKGKFILKGIK